VTLPKTLLRAIGPGAAQIIRKIVEDRFRALEYFSTLEIIPVPVPVPKMSETELQWETGNRANHAHYQN
jgi:hypothetical protein